jgi:hypothetical protein
MFVLLGRGIFGLRARRAGAIAAPEVPVIRRR